MTITLNLPDDAIAAEQYRVDQYNAGSGQPALSIAEFAQLERDDVTAQRAATKSSADLAAMASNESLMQLGLDVSAASPAKQAAAMAAAREALDA